MNRGALFLSALVGLVLAWHAAQAHPVTVDGNAADWTLALPPVDNLGHIARNSQGEGEYVWRDAAGDERTDFPDSGNADILQFRVTLDDQYLYFLVELSNVTTPTGDGAPQVQVAIDFDGIANSGQSWLGSLCDTQVSAAAAWEYLVVTRFGSGTAPAVYDTGWNEIGAGGPQAVLAGNIIEIAVPTSIFTVPPSAPPRFTVAVLRADASDGAWDIAGVSDVLDAVTNYGAPGSFQNTWSEVGDGTLDYHFEIWFSLDASSQPSPPLVINEVLYDGASEPQDEWIEVFNRTGQDNFSLDGFKLGDEETPGGTEGMVAFPLGHTIGLDDVVVVANNGATFVASNGFAPDFEIADSGAVPDMFDYAAWSATGSVQLANGGDQLLLLDPCDTVIDVVTYGSGAWPGVTAGPDVAENHSLERPQARPDSDDCDADMVDRAVPTPGAVTWLLALGAGCSEAVECLSGFCASGVCCGSACDGICDALCDSSGNCQPVTCPAPANDCQLADCDPASGCNAAAGVSCDDGDACTQGESCDGAGNCGGGSQVICPPPANSCQLAVCDSATGCYAASGTSCDDADACTSGDTCDGAGSCSGTTVDCDDSDPCTDDSCDPGSGCQYAFNTAPCDDGEPCTWNDACDGAGNCTGATYSCDDGNECTDDYCNGDGTCSHDNNTSSCDDASVCTVGDACDGAGNCTGTPIDCDDGDPCTDDSCDPSAGCQHAFNTAPCDDGDPCTWNDTCDGAGNCTGTAYSCDDGNVCTDDTCNGDGSCSYAGNAVNCDDADPCTYDDVCAGGTCAGTAYVCNDGSDCTVDTCNGDGTCSFDAVADGSGCDDGNPCTRDDACNGGVCSGILYSCNDSNPCTDDMCNGDGTCQYVDNSAPCNDGDACSEGDTCSGGACQPGSPVVCDDGNACTDDSCNPLSGCVFTPNNDSCDDGDACTEGDTCSGGSCQPGSPVVCDDGNICTDDSCAPLSGCVFTPNSASCDDGDDCTMNDVCSAGSCSGVPLDADGDGYVAASCSGDDCDDNDDSVNPGAFEGPHGDAVCADGVDNDCDGATDAVDPGCRQCTSDGDCSDGNACNGEETCVAGSCQPGTALDCDDQNPCTDDSCDAVAGCQHANNNSLCDDGNACTTADVCSGGSCQGTTISCDDLDPCTDDSCDPVLGCQHAFNTASCDDGNLCTTGDTCQAGTCVGTPRDCSGLDDACNTGSCDPQSGNCQALPRADGTSCDDGDACTGADVCSGGTCGGTAISCDDGDPCTDDTCDPATGCQYTYNTASCDDGDPCTENDSCQLGSCAGQEVDCSSLDGNCLAGVCDRAAGGCVTTAAPDGSGCDDGDPCTENDTCRDGVCSGTAPDCSSLDDQCHQGQCDPGSGQCVAQPRADGTPCDDGDDCTMGDTCQQGVCQGAMEVPDCRPGGGSGCGCSSPGRGAAPALLVLLLGLLLAPRRRR